MSPPKLRKIYPHEKNPLIPIDVFDEGCYLGYFQDSDGYGLWGTSFGSWEGEFVYPSDVRAEVVKAPLWATHVIWYRRNQE